VDFKLEDQEYIELMKLLKLMGLVDTGGEAKIRIDNGEVVVNGNKELRRRHKIRSDFIVEFNGQIINVS
jgi:ribosome-associated protein